MCVEVMVKMNNPLFERNGELALWIDGAQIIDLQQGSPLGNWVFNMFIPNPAGTPFEGYRWRAIDLLKINWIWLTYYTTGNPSGFVGKVWWDHVVLAKKYIGTDQHLARRPAARGTNDAQCAVKFDRPRASYFPVQIRSNSIRRLGRRKLRKPGRRAKRRSRRPSRMATLKSPR